MSHSFLITTLHPSLLTHLIQPPPPLSFLLCIPLKLPFSSPLPSRLAPPLLPPPPLSLYLCISFKLHFSSLLLSNFPSVSPQQSFPLLSSSCTFPAVFHPLFFLHLLVICSSTLLSLLISTFSILFPSPSSPHHTILCSPLLSPLIPATLPPLPACVTYILMSSYLLSSHRPHFLLGSTSAHIFETTLPLSVHAHSIAIV